MMLDHTSITYTEASIQVLEGLEAVRKRPAMYIGNTDHRGLHHLVYEILNNAVDESLNGFGDTIDMRIYKDGSIEVKDNGSRIPTGLHESGKPTVEVIFTVLHAGGKFGQGGYKASGGLHGVGAAVVNALSEWFEVTTYRDGKEYRQSFHYGGKPKTDLQMIGPTKRSGTKIHFQPDSNLFSTVNFSFETIADRLRESAFLFKDLSITLNDERTNVTQNYHYTDGLVSFIHYLNEGKNTIHDVVSFEGEQQGMEEIGRAHV